MKSHIQRIMDYPWCRDPIHILIWVDTDYPYWRSGRRVQCWLGRRAKAWWLR